jgi:hypothetical protein
MSDVDICNMALYLLGAESIQSFEDNTDRAKVCKLWYSKSRDTVLRAHDWNFAIKRETLAADSDTPENGYDYQYVLPTNPYCLRVIELNDDPTVDWVVEGRRLLTDETEAIIKYIARITETGTYDSLFMECLAAKIAEVLAMPITKSPQIMKSMHDLYVTKLAEARGLNAGERGAVPEPTSDFISVRY